MYFFIKNDICKNFLENSYTSYNPNTLIHIRVFDTLIQIRFLKNLYIFLIFQKKICTVLENSYTPNYPNTLIHIRVFETLIQLRFFENFVHFL